MIVLHLRNLNPNILEGVYDESTKQFWYDEWRI
jgi:hypothetical protein